MIEFLLHCLEQSDPNTVKPSIATIIKIVHLVRVRIKTIRDGINQSMVRIRVGVFS